MELTLLTDGQVFGNDCEKKLEVLRKYGTRSAVSDLAILTGGFCENEGYCTKSYRRYSRINVVVDGIRAWKYVDDRSFIVRPVLLSSSFSQISSNRMRGYNGTEEVEIGEYPQYVPGRNTQIELEIEYRNERLQLTGREYTFDYTRSSDYEFPFWPVTYQEYEYIEKRYIRIKARNSHDRFKLSNGDVYDDGDYVWVEVLPVKWLIDDETQMLISKIGLLSGIRFHAKDKEYNGDFSTAEMKEYLDKYMIKDLFQSTILKHSADMTPKELLAEATEEFRKILAKGGELKL